MKRKIHSTLIVGILLMISVLAVIPTVEADTPHAVKGIVYVNDEIPESPIYENIIVKIVFTEDTYSDTVYEYNFYGDDTNYNIGFFGHDGETADIVVEYYGIDYVPVDNDSVYIESGSPGFWLNLHIEPPADLPPSKVTGLSVSDAKDGKLNLAWSAATDDFGVDHYNIYRDDAFLTTRAGTSYQNTGLTNGQEYTYQVSAVDTIGQEGEKSDQASGTPTASGGGGGNGGGGGGGTTTLSSPKAEAGGPYSGFVDEEITFDGSGSTDSDGTIEKYKWDFDDDGDYDDGTGVSPTYTWSSPGEYTIELQVTDNDNLKGTDTATVVISRPNRNPSDPIVTGTQDGTISTEYTYTAVSIDLDDHNLNYLFDWGDETTTSKGPAANNTEVNATHNWTTAKMYKVKVQATDTEGGSSGWTIYPVFIDITYEKQDDGTYYVDNESDGTWDAIYDPVNNKFTDYEEEEPDEPDEPTTTPSDEDNTIWYILGILIIIGLLLLLVFGARKKKKTEK